MIRNSTESIIMPRSRPVLDARREEYFNEKCFVNSSGTSAGTLRSRSCGLQVAAQKLDTERSYPLQRKPTFPPGVESIFCQLLQLRVLRFGLLQDADAVSAFIAACGNSAEGDERNGQNLSIIQTLLPLVMPAMARSRPLGAAMAQVRNAPRWSQRAVAWPSRST